MTMTDEQKAAQIALERKPRGKLARAFYRHIEELVDEFEALKEIKGQDARERQIAIGREIELYKFPMIANHDEYCIAQDSGWCIEHAKQGGEYYPKAQRRKDEEEAYSLIAKDLRAEGDDIKPCIDDDIPW